MHNYKRLLTILFAFICAMSLMAQQPVTGVVVNEFGVPIVGAAVIVDGTTLSTITDEDGRFEISAPADATLIISYKGYNIQRTSVASMHEGKDLNIVLVALEDPDADKRQPRTHRVAVWASGGALCLPRAFKDPDNSSSYTSIAGELGLGYQYYYKHFLFTTGLEVMLTNYSIKFSATGLGSSDFVYPDSYTARVKDYCLQVPLFFGMEYPWFYWQAGAKVRFFSYTNAVVEDERYTGKKVPDFAHLIPALEVGTSIKSERTGVNCKFGVFAETCFDPATNDDGTPAASGRLDFTYLLAGLKLTIAY